MSAQNMFQMNMSKEDSNYECDELLIREIDQKLQDKVKKAKTEFSTGWSKDLRASLLTALSAPLLALIGVAALFLSLTEYFKGQSIALYFAIGALALLAVSAFLYVRSKRKAKDGYDEKEYYTQFDAVANECEAFLNIPEMTREIDVFAYFYTEENGERKNYYESGAYVNEVMEVFEEDGKLCLYCFSRVWAFPIDCIEEIVEVKEDVRFTDWTKSIEYNRGNYMQYKISKIDNEYTMNGYYSVRFTYEGKAYELFVPSYDIEAILSVTKMKVK